MTHYIVGKVGALRVYSTEPLEWTPDRSGEKRYGWNGVAGARIAWERKFSSRDACVASVSNARPSVFVFSCP